MNAIEEADRTVNEMLGLDQSETMKRKPCPSCRHPEGDCGGDFLHKDDAAEFVADSYEPPDYD